ncbi:hypothetical protein HPB52_013435 [Rhipicephalus sanguineus]|uniref:Uncharacterized protein n=1 Tax=Rhipicephalus sanguineus TaxID=34632 RepID=A0A9D4QC82_RHISA|nr:hypothetical protein HPB52_013435 [Rhipicephalus sanguineus]
MAPSPPENPTDEGDGYVVLQSGETIPIVNTTLMPPAPGCDVAKLPVRRGFLESQPVSVLRDTGCNTVVVRHSLIPRLKMTGTTRPVFLLDRTIRYLPEAIVFLDTLFFTGLARVKCMRDPLYDVVLGNIEGARPPNDPCAAPEDLCLGLVYHGRQRVPVRSSRILGHYRAGRRSRPTGAGPSFRRTPGPSVTASPHDRRAGSA